MSHGFDSPVLDLPPVPAGVSLSGHFMPCVNPECGFDRARECWKGGTRIALCPKCHAGYSKQKPVAGGVARKGAAPVAKEIDRHALARRYRELRKARKLTNVKMIEAMNRAPGLGVVFKPMFPCRLAPTMINEISDEWLLAMQAALDHVEVAPVQALDVKAKKEKQPILSRAADPLGGECYSEEEIWAIAPAMKMLVLAHRMGVRCRVSMDVVVV